MKIAGLDLSSLDIHHLSAENYNIIYKSLVKNVEMAYGEVERHLQKQLINNLNYYISLNLPAGCSTYNIGTVFGDPDLNMAMCLYMLPERSKDPTVQQYLNVVNKLDMGLQDHPVINVLRAQPFSFDNIVKISKIVKMEREKLNITGFWKNSVKQLFAIVSDQLLLLSYQKLHEINREFNYSPIAIATKVIYFIEILHYINQHKKERGFMVLMDVYQLDERSLRGFTREVLSLLKKALLELEAMPDNGQESIAKSCSLLLLRAANILKESMTTQDSKVIRRVSPDN